MKGFKKGIEKEIEKFILDKATQPRGESLTTYYFTPEKLKSYRMAMADVICWLNGFKAAGGEYSPGSIEELRNLNDALESIRRGNAASTEAHT